MLIVLPLKCFADNTNDDWQIIVVAQSMKNYLAYLGSKLTPNIKVSVAFTPAKNGNLEPQKYKDLYYTNTNVIGCRQYGDLDITPGTLGTITVNNFDKQLFKEDEGYSAANAICRVYLDLYLRKCLLRKVILPLDSFAIILNALYQNGFYPASTDNSTSTLFMLHIASDPPGNEQNVVYCQ